MSTVRDPLRALVQQLESLSQYGVAHVPRVAPADLQALLTPQPSSAAPRPAAIATSASSTSSASQAAPPTAPKGPQPATVPAPVQQVPVEAAKPKPAARATAAPADRQAALDIIRHEVAGCTRCPELARTRNQTVFGVGDPHAKLVLLGEAPGADEDAQGEPFVGRAGQLLTKIIEACKLSRDEVYILNTIKCRPPGNRNPLPEESTNCREYLDRQLDIIQPEYICCLGSVAARALLNTETTIGRLRGKFHDYRGIAVLCTYHPAYLLRNPGAKKDVWEDMKLLMARMGRPVS